MTVKIYNQGLIEIKALKMNRGESTFLSFLCGMLYANFDGVIEYLSVRARVKEMILVLILHIIIGISLSLLFFFFIYLLFFSVLFLFIYILLSFWDQFLCLSPWFFFVHISIACLSTCYCIIQANTWFKSPLRPFFTIVFIRTCCHDEGLLLSWLGGFNSSPTSSVILHIVICFSQTFCHILPPYCFKCFVTPTILSGFHCCRYFIQILPQHW